MAEDRTDPLADLFTLFAAPLSGTVRSLEQFRKGVDEFLNGVENFNRTMANLNETSERINSLLADVEEPIRAAIPQVTRTVKAADEMMQVVSGPAMAVAPGLNRLADTLSTPAFAQLPAQIGQFSELLGEVSHRLSPLTQLAESAGGLFGGFRMPGMRTTPPAGADSDRTIVTNTTRRSAADVTARSAHDLPEAAHEPAAPTATAKKSTAKKSTAKKRTPKKSAAKKRTPKKSAAKKRTPKKSAAKKSTAKKSTAKKRTAKKSAAKKSTAKKSTAKKRSAKTTPNADG